MEVEYESMKLLQRLIMLALAALFVAWRPAAVLAREPEAEATAQLVTSYLPADSRVNRLKLYLETLNSPLAEVASHFVLEADRLDLDWRLVAAIAGVESTFGKHIPTGSYNAWGWGVFTGAQDGVHFKDWKDGIAQISEGLRYNYIEKGAVTIEQIGRIYAASPAWSWKVRFFLAQIEEFIPNRIEFLDITI